MSKILIARVNAGLTSPAVSSTRGRPVSPVVVGFVLPEDEEADGAVGSSQQTVASAELQLSG